jgi:gluconolactonase
MTTDSEGYIYTTGATLNIFDKTGKQVDSFKFPGRTGNVCFGGKDGHTLFIAANTEVYTLQMRTHRVGSQ